MAVLRGFLCLFRDGAEMVYMAPISTMITGVETHFLSCLNGFEMGVFYAFFVLMWTLVGTLVGTTSDF